MSHAVYILCAATSAVCAVLLLRRCCAARNPLVFWAALCFLALTAANVLLFVDLVVVPHIDLATWRNLITFVGGSLLLYGLIRNET